MPVAVHVGVPNAASNVSATVAPTTFDGPALLTTIVYVRPTPGVYVAEPSVLVIDRSAAASGVSVSVAELLPGVGSVTPAGTRHRRRVDQVAGRAGLTERPSTV